VEKKKGWRVQGPLMLIVELVSVGGSARGLWRPVWEVIPNTVLGLRNIEAMTAPTPVVLVTGASRGVSSSPL